jgi:hypothetical protein
VNQEAFQRLSLLLPACTILATELTIIERASLEAPRPWISELITRSAAVRGRFWSDEGMNSKDGTDALRRSWQTIGTLSRAQPHR